MVESDLCLSMSWSQAPLHTCVGPPFSVVEPATALQRPPIRLYQRRQALKFMECRVAWESTLAHHIAARRITAKVVVLWETVLLNRKVANPSLAVPRTTPPAVQTTHIYTRIHPGTQQRPPDKMPRAKRSKDNRKLMDKFSMNFGFRKPYQVLMDADFVLEGTRCKMEIIKRLEDNLHARGEIKPSMFSPLLFNTHTHNVSPSLFLPLLTTTSPPL